jgi:hypothetical protein
MFTHGNTISLYGIYRRLLRETNNTSIIIFDGPPGDTCVGLESVLKIGHKKRPLRVF